METHKRVCDSSPSRWHLLIAPSDPVWVTHIVAACGSDVWQTGLLMENDLENLVCYFLIQGPLCGDRFVYPRHPVR